MQLKREIQKQVRLDQREIADQCKQNPKIFWKYVNNKRKRKSFIDHLKSVDEEGNNITVAIRMKKKLQFQDPTFLVFTLRS